MYFHEFPGTCEKPSRKYWGTFFQGTSREFRVLPGASGHFRVLPGVLGTSVTSGYFRIWIFPGTSGYFRVLPGISSNSWYFLVLRVLSNCHSFFSKIWPLTLPMDTLTEKSDFIIFLMLSSESLKIQ